MAGLAGGVWPGRSQGLYVTPVGLSCMSRRSTGRTSTSGRSASGRIRPPPPPPPASRTLAPADPPPFQFFLADDQAERRRDPLPGLDLAHRVRNADGRLAGLGADIDAHRGRIIAAEDR